MCIKQKKTTRPPPQPPHLPIVSSVSELLSKEVQGLTIRTGWLEILPGNQIASGGFKERLFQPPA